MQEGTEEGCPAQAKLDAKRRQNKERQQRHSQKVKDAAAAAAAADPPVMGVVDAITGEFLSGNMMPNDSVHTCGATDVERIADTSHLNLGARTALDEKLEGLFGSRVFEGTYAQSAARSKRYSLQLLPVDKESCTEEAPWMEKMVAHVQGVLSRLRIIGPQHVLGAMTLLLSMEGACQQSWHCDFKHDHHAFVGRTGKGRVKLMDDGTVPYPVSVLIAFHEEGASLPVKGAATISFG